MKPFFHGFFFVFLAGFGCAAETATLGPNLTYLRVHSLGDAETTLPAALAEKHACVLDLRYVIATEPSLPILRTAIAGHPAEHRLYVLVSPVTPAGILDAISANGPASAITLGVPGSNPAPRITIHTDAATDRKAFEAFDHGTPIEDLISGKIEKERFDEATLVQEFKNGNPDPEPSAPEPTKGKSGTNGENSDESTASPAPLRDRVLQRAIQLHQALLALRR